MTNYRPMAALCRFMIAFFCVSSVLAGRAWSQTYDHPIVVSIEAPAIEVRAGDRSALIVTFRMPRGFLIGTDDPSARNPVATRIEVVRQEHFTFEDAEFPAPVQIGIPVHKGIGEAHAGETRAVVPFRVNEGTPAGDYEIVTLITYTPSLDAGHLRTHAREPYTCHIKVTSSARNPAGALPEPSTGPVPEDFVVIKHTDALTQPMKTLLYQWQEDTPIPRALHWLWIDPPNHGKHIQTAWLPYMTLSDRTGQGAGVSVQLANSTREGIMTGFLQVRGYHNEYNGGTLESKVITCPAAYFNYQLSAEISPGSDNRRLNFHMENLTLGVRDRFGFEVQGLAVHEPRARFYGLGPGTKEEDQTNYNHKETGGYLDFYWLFAPRMRVGVGAVARSVDVGSGSVELHDEMPWTTDFTNPGGPLATVPGISGATVVGGRFSVVYDSRNSEFAPSAGTYCKLTAGYNQVSRQLATSPRQLDSYGRFTADFRRYFSTIDQNWTLVLRNAWTMTTSRDIPFFDQADFGGGFSDRGFITGRFVDQHSVFFSVELRRLIMPLGLLGIPMEVEMAPFVDAGQVFDSNEFAGVFNVNPGMSVRFLNKPNVGIVSNLGFGQDGPVLTGGLQLPF